MPKSVTPFASHSWKASVTCDLPRSRSVTSIGPCVVDPLTHRYWLRNIASPPPSDCPSRVTDTVCEPACGNDDAWRRYSQNEISYRGECGSTRSTCDAEAHEPVVVVVFSGTDRLSRPSPYIASRSEL